jgi:hypothetical protein
MTSSAAPADPASRTTEHIMFHLELLADLVSKSTSETATVMVELSFALSGLPMEVRTQAGVVGPSQALTQQRVPYRAGSDRREPDS